MCSDSVHENLHASLKEFSPQWSIIGLKWGIRTTLYVDEKIEYCPMCGKRLEA